MLSSIPSNHSPYPAKSLSVSQEVSQEVIQPELQSALRMTMKGGTEEQPAALSLNNTVNTEMSSHPHHSATVPGWLPIPASDPLHSYSLPFSSTYPPPMGKPTEQSSSIALNN